MSGATVSIFLTLAVAVAAHALVPHYWLASTVAGVVATILFVAVKSLIQGHIDPYFPAGVLLNGPANVAISLICGIPFAIARRKRRSINDCRR